MDTLELAERIRAAVLDAATRAYEDAGMQGLCAEGRWEAAVSAVRRADLRSVLSEIAPSPEGGAPLR